MRRVRCLTKGAIRGPDVTGVGKALTNEIPAPLTGNHVDTVEYIARPKLAYKHV